MQDTLSDNAPYRLQVFFGTADGKFNNVVTCTKCIDPRYPEGRKGYATGNDFYTVEIFNNILVIKVELLRGNYEHKFRYQNNVFQLIGFSQSASNGIGLIESIDFNLSTGKHIVTIENYETDKIISKTTRVVKIRPLPNLKTFKPHDDEHY